MSESPEESETFNRRIALAHAVTISKDIGVQEIVKTAIEYTHFLNTGKKLVDVKPGEVHV